MIIQELLETQLHDRLRDRLGDLCETTVWDGAWDALASPKRHSFPALAAMVSLTGFTLVHRGQGILEPQRLHRPRADGEPPCPPVYDTGESSRPPPCPQARLDVAVTFISAHPQAECRAMEVLDLAERAVPVMIEAAIEDIRGTNLYGPALYEAGMTAFALLGGRRVELAPPLPDRALPESVRARGLISREGSRTGLEWPNG